MKTISGYETDHGEEYVLRSEAEAAIDVIVEFTSARQNEAWRLLCDQMVAAERERLLSALRRMHEEAGGQHSYYLHAATVLAKEAQ